MNSIVVEQVLDKLIQARLIRLNQETPPGEEQIELTHEALIHNWSHYQQWLEEEELKRYKRWRLAKDAQDWDIQGQPNDLLLQQRKLAEVRNYRNLSKLENEFIEASARAILEIQRQQEEQANQHKQLENELATLRLREDTQNQRLQTLTSELQAAKLREASQTSRLEELESLTTELLVQKRRNQRDRLLAILFLGVAIAATGMTIFERQHSTQTEVQQTQ